MRGYIYKITNRKTGKVYIGQTVQNPATRFAEHVAELNAGRKKNAKFQAAWNKYGRECFSFEVLLQCDESELDEHERRYIRVYDSFKNGYNATIGGKQCMEHRKHTPKARGKMAASARSLWSTEEHRKKMRTAHSLNRPVICVNSGAIFQTSIDAAEAAGVDNANIIRACNKKSMRCGKDDRGNPLLWAWLDEYNGYSIADVYLGNRGGNNRKKVRNKETGAVYQSAAEAARACGRNKSTIIRACRGQSKSRLAQSWEFA